VAYRLSVGKPPYKQPLDKFNHVGSTIAHLLLYGLMILMRVTGYIFTGAGGHPLPFFGLFGWPSLVPKDRALSQLAGAFHYWGAWAICTILVVHVSAVAWHCWAKGDEVLARMLPARERHGPSADILAGGCGQVAKLADLVDVVATPEPETAL
jgi:cytochrome b561